MIKTLKKLSGICLILLSIALPTAPYAQNNESSQGSQSVRNQPVTSQTARETLTQNTAHPSAEIKPPEQKRELSMFFKIGIALNIIMLTAYMTWAVRQWRQSKNQSDKTDQ